jgi:hypothetical protein
VTCASAKFWFWIAAFIATRLPKALIRELVVVGEVKVELDQRSTSVGVITHAIASDPRIQQWKGQNKNDEQDYFEPTLRGLRG